MNINNLRQFLFIAILAFAVINVVADVGYDDNTLSTVSECTRQFSTDFYKALATKESSNFITSPISLNFLLSMLSFGARGTAQEQLKSLLKTPDDENVTKKGYQQLIDSLNNVTGVELWVANKLYTSDGYELKHEFKEITKTYFRSESENIDFGNQSKAAGTINKWCANQTNNRITDILKSDDLKDAVLVLVNAIYFKGTWNVPFDPKNTKMETFYINTEKSVMVPMMYVLSYFFWDEIPELDATFVKIFYEKPLGDLSMYIILPNEINGLQKIENSTIDYDNLRGTYCRVKIRLPKFKTESTFDLLETLEKMGISEIFKETADFQGMIPEKPVHVSKVIQKVFIEVNEEGSEEAADTAVTRIKIGFPKPPPRIFYVNKPFYYAIYHEVTKTVLFQGRVQDPTKK